MIGFLFATLLLTDRPRPPQPLPRSTAPVAADTVSADTVAADTVAADTTPTVTIGGFLDTYVAWDSHRPSTLDRRFTTGAARHSEFNINLAVLDATISAPRLRGRFAIQYGTSVQANYAGEPRVGQLSGPEVSRFIQEAYAGLKVAPTLWVDAGVFLAPFGAENWISRDNPVYTRSLIADNSPYYESGVRASWQPKPQLQLQLHVINGWQNISETNSSKAVAVRADWTASPAWTIAYDAFVGNEQPDSLPGRLRQFHELIVRWTPVAGTSLTATMDVGLQERGAGHHDQWQGMAVLLQHRLSPTLQLGGRIEAYADPSQVVVSTGLPNGLRATGGSINLDAQLHRQVVWRTEARRLMASTSVFPAGRGSLTRDNVVLVTSLALTF
ncbi:MAG: porin [Gemmatimonadaceae bacterium]|jgi:hypothetical protein